jgi:transposase
LFEPLKPQEAALQLLLTLPGIDRLAAAKWLVEIGTDMAAFGTADRLSKWAGVCPGHHESAGKRKPMPGNRYVRTVRCEIAWAAIRTTRQFKSRYQHWVIRRGTKKAIIAMQGCSMLSILLIINELYDCTPWHLAAVNRQDAFRRE